MRRTTKEERLTQAKECLDSGMTVKNWCAANGVPESTMFMWLRELRESDGGERLAPAPAFVELTPRVEMPEPPSAPIVARIGQVELHFRPGFDERDAARAMRAAASL